MIKTQMVSYRQHTYEVIRLGKGVALVSSKSEPGTWHQVEGGHCDCRSYEHRGRCAHVMAWRCVEPAAVPAAPAGGPVIIVVAVPSWA